MRYGSLSTANISWLACKHSPKIFVRSSVNLVTLKMGNSPMVEEVTVPFGAARCSSSAAACGAMVVAKAVEWNCSENLLELWQLSGKPYML